MPQTRRSADGWERRNRQNGKAERMDVMAKLAISDSTAVRLFDEMEKKGLIRQEGQMKGAYYVEAK